MLRVLSKNAQLKHKKRLLFKSFSLYSDKGLNTPIKLNNHHRKSGIINNDTNIIKLSNGLTVASQNQFGLQCTIGVVVSCAPRYESSHISGVSHFIEKLGFQSTVEYKNKNTVQDMLDKCGAMYDCQLGRDFIFYGVSGKLSEVESITNILSDIVLRPNLTADEVEAARKIVGYEYQAMRLIPPPDNLMNDLIHQAAFKNNTLGLPRYTPTENIDNIQRSDLVTFMAASFRPESMVLVGVGVDHDHFVDYANKYFVPKSDYILKDSDVKHDLANLGTDQSVPQMTGGIMTIEQNLEQYHDPMPEFAHVSLGLESCGMNSRHFVTACLLNTLMGGGGSFSAGGPGKGMYSRLYTNVLGYDWVNSALAINHSYRDTGLFTITGSASPKDMESLTAVLAKEMRTMATNIDTQELARAKCQLKSMLLMNLEMKPVVLEDIGRQVLYQGHRNSADVLVDCIEKVTSNDLADLVHTMLQGKVAMAAFGRLQNLPSLENVSKWLTSSERFCS